MRREMRTNQGFCATSARDFIDSVRRISRRRFLGDTAATGSIMASTPAWAAAPAASSTGERLASFDASWRFYRGDIAGAERPELDDRGWRRLDLPHDWSLEDLPGNPARIDAWAPSSALWNPLTRPVATGRWLAPAIPAPAADGPPLKVGPFDTQASAGGFDVGWTVGGVGWYRKRFSLRPAPSGRQVELRFDGAFMLTDVWLNSALLGSHVNGYTPFAFDLTPHLDPGGDNLLAVRVRNEGRTSRWYSGSGLYRHVWLVTTGPVRLPRGGLSVATPEASADQAKVRVRLEVENRSGETPAAQVRITLLDPAGVPVAAAGHTIPLAPGETSTAELTLDLVKPVLWSPDRPALYRLEATVQAQGWPEDRESVRFGVRKVEIDPAEGLKINGAPLKLKGACLHHDNGLLGAVAIDRAERRKAELLKAKGFNAVRCSHNAHSSAFLDACDALGLLVIDEFFDAWEQPKRPDDYARFFADHWREDLASGVRRDRNHPSVILWSIGNEIPEITTPSGAETAALLRQEILRLDPTRPITAALAPGVHGPKAATARQALDVAGYNYMPQVYAADRAANPQTVFVGTEQCAQFMHDAWRQVEAHPWVIGDFAWTGIDYLGEVGSGSSQLRPLGDPPPPVEVLTIFLWDYPAFVSGCGDLDVLGHAKPQSFYRDVLWGRSPLELFVQRPPPKGMAEQVGSWGWPDELPSWTWPQAGQVLTVRAFTGGDEVRLLLDGEEIGRRAVQPGDKLIASFQVPYRPGALTAVALSQGVEIGRKSLQTTGPPARVRLSLESETLGASRDELAYVRAEILDAQGRLSPDAVAPLAFRLSGPAELAAAGSANPRGLESFRDPYCRTFHGMAQAIVRPTKGWPGVAWLDVAAPGLTSERLRIRFG